MSSEEERLHESVKLDTQEQGRGGGGGAGSFARDFCSVRVGAQMGCEEELSPEDVELDTQQQVQERQQPGRCRRICERRHFELLPGGQLAARGRREAVPFLALPSCTAPASV